MHHLWSHCQVNITKLHLLPRHCQVISPKLHLIWLILLFKIFFKFFSSSCFFLLFAMCLVSIQLLFLILILLFQCFLSLKASTLTITLLHIHEFTWRLLSRWRNRQFILILFYDLCSFDKVWFSINKIFIVTIIW